MTPDDSIQMITSMSAVNDKLDAIAENTRREREESINIHDVVTKLDTIAENTKVMKCEKHEEKLKLHEKILFTAIGVMLLASLGLVGSLIIGETKIIKVPQNTQLASVVSPDCETEEL